MVTLDTCDTCDMWHMTHDMWHVTRDMWHVTLGGRWTFPRNFSSLALTAWEWKFVEDIFTKDHWLKLINELMNEEGVCRTAPATLGLLMIAHAAAGICIYSNNRNCNFNKYWTTSRFSLIKLFRLLSNGSSNFLLLMNPKTVYLD